MISLVILCGCEPHTEHHDFFMKIGCVHMENGTFSAEYSPLRQPPMIQTGFNTADEAKTWIAGKLLSDWNSGDAMDTSIPPKHASKDFGIIDGELISIP